MFLALKSGVDRRQEFTEAAEGRRLMVGLRRIRTGSHNDRGEGTYSRPSSCLSFARLVAKPSIDSSSPTVLPSGGMARIAWGVWQGFLA